MIKLFDIQNQSIILTEHCYSLKTLRDIMEFYPDNHTSIFLYIFYMTCPDPDINPFFDYPDRDKEECILKEVSADFSTEDELIIDGLEFCRKLYETPTLRAYNGIKKMLDKIADYMSNSEITEGRDGNGTFILRAAKDFDSIRQSFKSTLKDLEEEQSSIRGNKNIGYDQ